MTKAPKTFEYRIAAMIAHEQQTAVPTAAPPDVASAKSPGKPGMIPCSPALTLGILLGLFSDQLIGKDTEAKQAAAALAETSRYD